MRNSEKTWIVAFIPSYIVYVDFSMLIDRELRDNFWQEYNKNSKKKLNADYKAESTGLEKTDAGE